MRYLVFLCALFLVACQPKVEPVKKPKSFDERHAPYDNEFLKLFGPDATKKDVDFYLTSAKEASSKITVRNDIFTESWQQQGPGNIGGRVNALAIDPQNDNVIYAGFARGGLWKTENAGQTWIPLWDDQVVQSVSSITIHPTNSNIIYAGSGDINISGNVFLGNGLFKSEDAGQTWTNIGLEETKVIGKIIVHPTKPDEILAATMGNVMIKDEIRGVYKTTNGGDSWEKVLFVDDDTGVHDIVFHPENPNYVLAAAWTRFRNGKESTVSSDKCRVYSSNDFGETWTLADMDIPEVTGRPAISFNENNSSEAYAMMMNNSNRYISLHKSVDSGQSWEMIDSTNESTPVMMGGFGWFFGRIGAMKRPEDGKDRVYLCGVDLWSFSEEDGFWSPETPPWWEYAVHADKHSIVTNSAGDIYLGTDGGIYKKEWGSGEWTDEENIPTNMFYRVETSPHVVDEYYGGMQDNGTSGGNADVINEWERLWGGDGFQTRFNPDNPEVQYFETQNGNITYTDEFGSASLDFGPMAGDRKNWDMQYILSPHNPSVVYTGTYRPVRFDILDSYNMSVDSIGPRLTDELEFLTSYHTITSLDESPLVEGLLYYGTADGNIWKREEEEWIQINNGLDKHYVTSIKASPYQEGTVYVTLSNYKFYDNSPRIYKSEDYGETWVSIHNGLPSGAVNDILIYPEYEDKLLFAATNVGVYGTIDGGESWEKLSEKLPSIPVNDMAFNAAGDELVAGTYGRSINTYNLTEVFNYFIPESTEELDASAVKILPNPFVDRIKIESEVPVAIIEIYSQEGRMIYDRKYSEEIDLSQLTSGVYFIRLKSEDGKLIETEKLVKS